MQGNLVAAGKLNGTQVEDLRSVSGQLQGFFGRDGANAVGFGDDSRVGREKAIDVGVDLAVVSEPPRPRVVTSSSSEIPWNPATIATCPSEIARAMRSGTMPVICARP